MLNTTNSSRVWIRDWS